MSDPLISIAIPVRDAGERLRRTLESIAASTAVDLGRIEVSIADDGSTDDAVEAASAATWPFSLNVRRGRWNSQSAATNEAIGCCRGEYVLLSAQDIRFDPGLVRAHLDAHERFEGPAQGVAVLGDLPYAPEADVSPFTFYLVNGGFQFAYFLIRDPHRVPPNFLYAPNVSLRRETLQRVGGFDEAFPYGLQDTDLGIRLATIGVRLVYEPAAIGLHDHPTTLEAFRRRMARIGPLRLDLEAKHPDHEPSLPSWDLVVSACLAYDPLREELDLARIETLQPVVDARPEFRELWQRNLAGTLQFEALSAAERSTLQLTDRLFAAYGRVLQSDWSGAYLDAAIERSGLERVNEMLHARLARLQAPRPGYRIIEAALGRRGLRPAALAPVHCRSARVVHGIRSRAEALELLDPLIPPSAGAVDQELVLIVEPGALDDATRAELERCAVVFEADVPAGLARVASSIDAELLIVTDASCSIEEHRAVTLAERLLRRFPRVGALGGAVDHGRGSVRFGAGYEEGRLEPLVAPVGAARGAVPLDAPVPECVILRRSAAVALSRAAPAASDEPWELTLGRAIRDAGEMVLHVPDLVARPRDAPAETEAETASVR